MKMKETCNKCCWYWYDEEYDREMCHIPDDYRDCLIDTKKDDEVHERKINQN